MESRRHLAADSANLDFARAVAVLCVFFAHLIDVTRGHPSEVTWHLGQIGVLIFFVHTALVLMRSLERSDRTGMGLFTEFYTRRAFRIYPLAMVCVTIAALIGGWPIWTTFTHLALITNLTYTTELCCTLWTLPIEVQMYVLLPMLFLSLRAASLLTVGLTWCLFVVLGMVQPVISGRLTVLAYGPCFLAGVIAWWLARRSEYRVRAWLWPVAFLSLWPIWFLATRDHQHYYRWAFTLALGLTLPWFSDLSSRWITRPSLLIATYSYGLYLSHSAVQRWAFDLSTPHLRWPAMIVASVTVPMLMYHLVEQPMIQRGRAIVARIRTRWKNRLEDQRALRTSQQVELQSSLPPTG